MYSDVFAQQMSPREHVVARCIGVLLSFFFLGGGGIIAGNSTSFVLNFKNTGLALVKYILRKLNKPLLYFDSEVFIVQVIFLI